MQTQEGKVLYAKCKSMVEATFGKGKPLRRFRQFLRTVSHPPALGRLIRRSQP